MILGPRRVWDAPTRTQWNQGLNLATANAVAQLRKGIKKVLGRLYILPMPRTVLQLWS